MTAEVPGLPRWPRVGGGIIEGTRALSRSGLLCDFASLVFDRLSEALRSSAQAPKDGG